MRIAVPAFWGLPQTWTDTSGQVQNCWQSMQAAGNTISVVVAESSFPALASNNPAAKMAATTQFGQFGGGVLVMGYVFSRAGGGMADSLLSATQILQGTHHIDANGNDVIDTPGVDDWYTQFPGVIDGIYFDNAVLAPDAGGAKTYPLGPGGTPWTAEQFWTDLIASLRQNRPGIRIFLLAGQCPDEWVVQQADYALLWEEEFAIYRRAFYPLRGNAPAHIETWWKNPAYRDRISHTITGCSAGEVQWALELTRERNAGNCFLIDVAGAGYPRLPPYWNDEVWNAASYEADRARNLSDEEILRGARRYGVANGKLHAWTNGEQATYATGQVRGTYLLDDNPDPNLALGVWRDVPRSALVAHAGDPPPELWDIPTLWWGAHVYAQSQGFETAMPTFETGWVGGQQVYGVVLLRPGAWLQHVTVPVDPTLDNPTFAEPISVMRRIHRWAQAQNYKTGWPTFVPDDPTWPPGRVNSYDAYVVSTVPNVPEVNWEDVPAATYLALL
jgi:hypothetical protein